MFLHKKNEKNALQIKCSALYHRIQERLLSGSLRLTAGNYIFSSGSGM